MDSRLLLSVDDAAATLSTTPRRLRQLVRDGRIPSVDIGDGQPRFSPDELRRWLHSLSEAVGQPQEKEGAVLLGDGRSDGQPNKRQ